MAITYVNVYGQLVDLAGVPVIGARVTVVPRSTGRTVILTTDGGELDPRGVTATTTADGSFSFSLCPSASAIPAGLTYKLTGPFETPLTFALPTTGSYNPVNGSTIAKPATFGVPARCVISGLLVDLSGTPRVGVNVSAGLDGWDTNLVATSSGGIVVPRTIFATSVTDGSFSFNLFRAASLLPAGLPRTWFQGPNGLYGKVTVPDLPSVLLTSLL